jgi:hypothetical protein
MKKRKSLPKHCDFIYIDQCVLCGREEVDRERRYTPKPEDWTERIEFHDYACVEHFL